MGRYDRAPSNVMVEVLDFSPDYEWIAAKMRDLLHDEEVVSARVNPLGRVVTDRGVYVLDTEGLGFADPITFENMLPVDFYPEYPRSEHGTTRVAIVPYLLARLTDEEVMALPITERKPLHEFIRSFGARLEHNYKIWEQLLSSQINLPASLGDENVSKLDSEIRKRGHGDR